MAWVLGVLTSDGNIMDNGGIRLTLKYEDKDCVEKVRDLLAPKQDLAVDLGQSAYVRFNITSKEMKSDLEKLGVTPRKSLTVKPPKVPDELVSHYIRGLLDGDGSVLFRKERNYLYVNFCGNEFIIDFINKTLHRLCGVPIMKVRRYFKVKSYLYYIILYYIILVMSQGVL